MNEIRRYVLWATEVLLLCAWFASAIAAPALYFMGDREGSQYFSLRALIAMGFLFVGYCAKKEKS